MTRADRIKHFLSFQVYNYFKSMQKLGRLGNKTFSLFLGVRSLAEHHFGVEEVDEGRDEGHHRGADQKD